MAGILRILATMGVEAATAAIVAMPAALASDLPGSRVFVHVTGEHRPVVSLARTPNGCAESRDRARGKNINILNVAGLRCCQGEGELERS
jgi:hypothetical protein